MDAQQVTPVPGALRTGCRADGGPPYHAAGVQVASVVTLGRGLRMRRLCGSATSNGEAVTPAGTACRPSWSLDDAVWAVVITQRRAAGDTDRHRGNPRGFGGFDRGGQPLGGDQRSSSNPVTGRAPRW